MSDVIPNARQPATPRSRRLLTAALGVAIVPLTLLAFHALADGASVPAGPDPAVSAWPTWPYLTTCGSGPFDPVTVFNGPTKAERGQGRPERKLRRTIAQWQTYSPSLPRHHWRQLTRSPRHVSYARGRLPAVEVLALDKTKKGQWKFAGYDSGCEPTSVVAGRGDIVTWDLAEGQSLGPETTEISIILGPGPCSGGRPQNPRAMAPAFFELDGNLMMMMRLRPLPPGYYTCPGTYEPPLVIELPSPLGDRQLYDGSVYPPREQWPPRRHG